MFTSSFFFFFPLLSLPRRGAWTCWIQRHCIFTAGRKSEQEKKKKSGELFRPEQFQTLSAVFGQCAAALVRHSVLTRPLTILKCHYGAIQQRVENLFSAEKRPSSKHALALSETGQVTGICCGPNSWKQKLGDNWSNGLVSPHLLNSSEHITPQPPSHRNPKLDSTELGSHCVVRTCTKVPKPQTTHSRFLPKNSHLIRSYG